MAHSTRQICVIDSLTRLLRNFRESRTGNKPSEPLASCNGIDRDSTAKISLPSFTRELESTLKIHEWKMKKRIIARTTKRRISYRSNQWNHCH
jgi:hypothetical protein